MAKNKKLSNSRRNAYILGLLLFGLLIYLAIDAITFNGSRSFYCLKNGTQVTVWNRLNNETYIIFKKYKKNEVPLDNYLKTTNTNALTIIALDSISRGFAVYNDYGEKIKINSSKDKIRFYPFDEKESFLKRFYVDGHIKDGLYYMQIDIGENLVVVNGVIQ